MTTHADTFEIAKILKAHDFSDKQTEAIVDVVRKLEAKQKQELVTREYFRAEFYKGLMLHGLAMAAAILAAAKLL